MQDQKQKISIAYTTRLVSDGLDAIIRQFDNFSVVSSSPVDKELFKRMGETPEAQILILQINCPGRKDLDEIQKLMGSNPLVKILLISHLPRTNIGMELIESGISGYLLKSCTKEDLLSALNKITEDKPYICSDITHNLFKRKKDEQDNLDIVLTDREKEILSLLVSSLYKKS